MLTADLVRVRIRGGELQLLPLGDEARARALALADTLLCVARDHIGRTRDELLAALDQIESAPRDRLLLRGLRKLIDDRCEFDVAADLPPQELRSDVFLRAAAARQHGDPVGDAVLAQVAAARGVPLATVVGGLYADLRGAHVLKCITGLSAQGLVDGYDLAQAQAVLLRAVRVRVDVQCRAAGAYRALFRKLKFLRLLVTIAENPPNVGGYQITIDGPFSLFSSVTRYGLQLALALPAIVACQRFSLTAEVRWGKQRQPLRFHLEGAPAPPDPTHDDAAEPPLPDEVAALLQRFRALATPWQVHPAPAILHLPGLGLCVPDLLFQHAATGERIYLEVMGFWSREAVWRRVELAERGLPERVLFAVSERLRVSEKALDQELPAALYVYKGAINPRLLADHLERLRTRPLLAAAPIPRR